MKLLIVAAICVAGSLAAGASAPAPVIAIIPRPAHVTASDGVFLVTPTTTIVTEAATDDIGALLTGWLDPSMGFSLKAAHSAEATENVIALRIDPSLARLGPEGYSLVIARDRVTIRAAAPAGVFYGVESLRQLLPPTNYSATAHPGVLWEIPCATIEDTPRFGWRGAMMDTVRHFMPKDFVLKFIDVMAMHKLNSFHWHLTDDQGWRIEIKQYPKLTEIGAWRKQTRVGHEGPNAGFDGIPHGGFYTQQDVRDVVEYARRRFVTIVPEMEMPGHAQAAIAAYPELGNTGEKIDVSQVWGVSKNIYNTEDSTIHFLQNVLDEVLALFPSKFIHIGGDEAPKDQWNASPAAQARIKALGLKDAHELQSYFVRQMDAYLASKGRRLIGWDEILEGGLAPGATVMSWQGTKGGIAAAQAGHDVVMSPTDYAYFDYYQARPTNAEPLAIGGFLPLEKVYGSEPVPAALDAEQAKHVLGAQANIWTEYIPTPEHFEYMAFPRLLAMAEIVWTPKEDKDLADFLARLPIEQERLKARGVNFRPIAGTTAK